VDPLERFWDAERALDGAHADDIIGADGAVQAQARASVIRPRNMLAHEQHERTMLLDPRRRARHGVVVLLDPGEQAPLLHRASLSPGGWRSPPRHAAPSQTHFSEDAVSSDVPC